jgi:hypothetical protein
MTKEELVKEAFKFANEEADKRGTFNTNDLIIYAYNQAIEDAANNAIADCNILAGDANYNNIEVYVIKGSILQLKKT